MENSFNVKDCKTLAEALIFAEQLTKKGLVQLFDKEDFDFCYHSGYRGIFVVTEENKVYFMD